MRPCLLPALLLLVACGPKDRQVQDMPDWRTEEGKQDLRTSILEDLIDQGATSEALTLISTMRAEGDERPVLSLYQGQAMALEGFSAEAERVLLAYRAEEPRDPRPLQTLGVLYADTGRTDEAIAVLQKSLELDDGDAPTWNNLGFLLLSEKRHVEAQEALQRAVALDGTEPRYRNNLGFALAANGRPRDAFEAFVSVAPPAEAHYNLGVALELAGEHDSAARHYRKAVQYDPDHLPSQDALARLEEPPTTTEEPR